MAEEWLVLPTLRDLCSALGEDLTAVCPTPAPDVEVSAVHVSDLVDPTRYLDGGELLLTTGLEFGRSARSARWYRSYVDRLVSTGVAGLAFGLGAVHDDVPAPLVRAVERAGLPLLSVPAPTPFLTVSRAYWAMLAESDQRELVATIGAHRALIAAALSDRPVQAVLRRLATAVGGWAANLSADGEVLGVWPDEQRARASELQVAIDRMGVARLPSVATLPLGSQDVVIQPLGGGERPIGHLAVACPRPIPVTAQQVTMTAVALLTLEAVHAGRVRAAQRVLPTAALALLASGDVEAARRVAATGGLTLPAGPVRVAALRGAAPADVLEALERLPGNESRLLLSGELADTSPAVVAALLAGDDHDGAAWLAGLRRRVPDLAGVLGAATSPADMPAQLARLVAAAGRVGPGTVTDLATPAGTLGELLGGPAALAWAHDLLTPLLEPSRADLLGTLAAYLRHRGDAEPAAREIGVHRHTIGNRVARIERLLGTALDDPNAASELWLALRLTGSA